jgi:hypothetical protein
MGSLAAAAKETYLEKIGKKLWRHHVKAIDEMWTGIKKMISRLSIIYKDVYIYQDGLPLCGKEQEIVDALAKQGSPNHLAIQWLTRRGASVMGTEDPQLLLQEYNYLKQILAARDARQRKKYTSQYEEAASELLKKRDLYICSRINNTLPPGKTGILFIGLLHRVDELLPSDIRVNYLIYRLPFKRSFEMKLVK